MLQAILYRKYIQAALFRKGQKYRGACLERDKNTEVGGMLLFWEIESKRLKMYFGSGKYSMKYEKCGVVLGNRV